MLAPETSLEQVRLLGNLVRIAELLARLFEILSTTQEDQKECFATETAAVLAAGQRWQTKLKTLELMASIHVVLSWEDVSA